jgi:hypothetical protein
MKILKSKKKKVTLSLVFLPYFIEHLMMMMILKEAWLKIIT